MAYPHREQGNDDAGMSRDFSYPCPMYSELLSPLFRSCMAWPPHPIDNGAKWVTFVLSLLVLSVSHFSYDTSKMRRATERAAFCVSRWRSAVPAVSRRNRLKKRDYTCCTIFTRPGNVRGRLNTTRGLV